MAHANEDFVRAGVEAFLRGDLDTLQSWFFADGIVWHPGKNPLGGEYTGMGQVRGLPEPGVPALPRYRRHRVAGRARQ